MGDGAGDVLRARVRERYAHAARAVSSGVGDVPCCGEPVGVDAEFGHAAFGAARYSSGERGELPVGAVAASLGCGNPLAVAELRPGETVLDLGSGGGIDVLLSARRIGPAGMAYGLDMTEEMLELARNNAEQARVGNVRFLKGHIEDVPLPAAHVDVVISNCVINLSADKPAVFAEMFRVLRRGGRIGVTDVLAEDQLSPAERAERGAHVACIAGALTFTEYREQLARAGFDGVRITATHQVADGMHGALVHAFKP
ncbi:arsenite methyltransferase [Streptomyces sp. ODS28]|uniref:arsenite methyltransferase n=1 Tax=Streptomyces sp. ODS28 TaxID=3136688 RepID=UPI0031F16830